MICYECSEEVEASSHEYDGEPVCDDCWERFCTCTNCRDIYRVPDSVEHDGAYWCENCNNENWTMCSYERCGASVHNDDARYVSDEAYCETCYDRLFTYVECCDRAILSDNVCWGGSNALCEEHYHENYSECEGCGETCHNEDLYYSETDGGDYCRTCRDNNVENEEGGKIHPYEYKPKPDFMKLAYENTLFMGIELEVESTKDLKEEAAELHQYMCDVGIDDRFYFKWDGSVRDRNGNYSGFEIVSHPATLKWWHESKAWYNILKYLNKEQFSSFKTGKCGIHIHVNKSSMVTEHQGKLALFFWYNREWLKVFSMRDSQYAQYIPYTIRQAFRNPSPNRDRHVAVNFNNKDTIEFRTFRGTLNYNRFLATMQFVDAMCHFVKVSSIMTCGKHCFKEFIAYLVNTNRYNNLEKYLTDLDAKHNFDKLYLEVEL